MTDQQRRSRHLLPVPSEPAPVGTGTSGPADDAVPLENVVVQTVGAGARYGGRWVLADCSLRIPQGSVVAVVGRNGAGKTTLLQMLAGLRRPDAGSVTLFGEPSWPATAALLSRVGVVAQHKPLYGGLRVAEMLTLGRRMNPSWDQQYAVDRLRDRAIPLDAKVGRLSGGQRTQVALVMALAKRPSLLLLDEPLSDLDPVARREVMGALMVDLAERNVTVVLSSHSLADLTRACDWLVLVDAGRLRLADSIETLLAGHQLLIGPTELADRVSARLPVVSEFRGDRQAILLVEGDDPVVRLDPRWTVREPTVEDLVFAYLKRTMP